MQNTINRRTAITGTVAAVAMAPASAAISDTPVISDQLASLLTRCRAAEAAWKKTIDPLEQADDAWKDHIKANPLPMIPYFAGAIETKVFDREEMEREIARVFKRQRDSLATFTKINADAASAMVRALHAAEAETLADAHGIYDEIDRRKADFGLTAATEAYDTTCDAHENAMWDLLEYRATSLFEERARAAAILATPVLYEIILMDEQWTNVFLHSVAGVDMPSEEA